MALPFFNGAVKKRDQIIAIDLGARTTKAVFMQQKGDARVLSKFCVLDAPIYEKSMSVDLLAEHLKAVYQALDTKTKFVSLAIGVNDAIVRHTELPQIPVGDMRHILKMNSKNYLQQDLQGFTFDCFFILKKGGAVGAAPAATPGALETAKPSAASQKLKVLVGGAKTQLVNDLQAAIKQAGLVPDQIVPGVIGPVNAFELAMPEVFEKEAIALVDIGFKNTSVCLMQRGELVLTRVVNIGGDKLTAGLAEAMEISYAEAENIKVGMPAEVQSNLEPLLLPLGRDIRASLDFFEHQQDRTISQVYVTGGSARSEFIVRTLEIELGLPCRCWSPVSALQMALPPLQVSEIEAAAPQLAVAVGAALVAL